MARKMVVIPQPKVRPGERCWASNYRRRPEADELGECLHAEFSVDHVIVGHGGSWKYTVLLDEPSASGKVRRLYVDDDQIEPSRASTPETPEAET